MKRITRLTKEIIEIAVHFGQTTWATRAYLLLNLTTGKVLLIDTGSAGSEWIIIQAIQSVGSQPSDLEGIILTHWHEDHTGSLGALMEAAGDNVRVLVPAGEIDILQDQKPHPVPSWGWVGKVITADMPPGKLSPAQIARLEVALVDDPLLETWDLQLLNTPGHSQGHISLLSPTRQALFAGDALFCYEKTVFTFPHDDAILTEKTARWLLSLDFDWLLPGHCQALPYRLAPTDRQSFENPPGPLWYLLEKSFTVQRLVYSNGPRLIASPPSANAENKLWQIVGFLGTVFFIISLLKWLKRQLQAK